MMPLVGDQRAMVASVSAPDVVVIEPEQPGDVAAIRDVVGRAFAKQEVVPDLVERIRASPQYVPELALVARIGRTVVGFVMLSHAELVAADARFDVLTLSPLAVAPEFERRGIGSSLVRTGIAAADATGAGLITLEGSPAYYGRLGFTDARTSGVTIDLPGWSPPEAAQVYRLSAYSSTVHGRLVYPPAFDILH
jgi:putative acetyltransferase